MTKIYSFLGVGNENPIWLRVLGLESDKIEFESWLGSLLISGVIWRKTQGKEAERKRKKKASMK